LGLAEIGTACAKSTPPLSATRLLELAALFSNDFVVAENMAIILN
jgi:hypothetical protein